MTRKEFENLKIGDICVMKIGDDKGKKCEVVYIEDDIDGCDSILVRVMDQEFTSRNNGNRWLKLTRAMALDVIPYFK